MKKQILEGSQAVSQTINNIKPAVVSAYPITPQTHIVEDLAKLKADGKATYEYVRAESEFAAASIVTGASAAGSRVYTATSSQGILLMTEVLFNIAGMRLPVVLTCANRGLSAPITIWNDHQDSMTIRDSGWIMLFAENHQEAVEQHIMAYKIAETVKIPVMVNIDGFVLTHSYEPVVIPSAAEIKKYLPAYKPEKGEYLDPQNPTTFGAFAPPHSYMEIRQELYDDLKSSLTVINKEYKNFKKVLGQASKEDEHQSKVNNGLIEYYGPQKPKILLVAMGSVVGTIKDVVDDHSKEFSLSGSIGVLKIKTFRPFPSEEVLKIVKKVKYVAVLEKAVSLGSEGPLTQEIKSAVQGKTQVKVQNFVVGLGGRDITKDMIKKIAKEIKKKDSEAKFIGK
ncbi:pyruvate ferredoxin oxidoreductase [Candidatus Parcubacteria bacterium]|nr:MAG: pyruvate ferredoxin oxidoreductase [Candidatus Parcubacteria bacterium]